MRHLDGALSASVVLGSAAVVPSFAVVVTKDALVESEPSRRAVRR